MSNLKDVPFMSDAKRPLISVIVPVYQCAPYLNACVQSVLGQTYSNFELILVDDGSEDGSRELCENLCAQDPRISLLKQNHLGVSAARNAGIRAAKGEYLFFLDSDDAIHPEILERLCRISEETGAAVSVCEYYRFQSENFDKRINKLNKRKRDRNKRESLSLTNQEAFAFFHSKKWAGIWSTVWGKLIRRSNVERLWFDEEMTNGEDRKYVYQLLENGADAAVLRYRGYYYRSRSGSASKNITMKVYKGVYECDCFIRNRELEYGREAYAIQQEREVVSKNAWWWHAAGHGSGDAALKNYILELAKAERDSELWRQLGFYTRLQHFLAFHCSMFYGICCSLLETWSRIKWV